MAIELIDKIKPKNNGTFAMVDAHDVEMSDGTRLDEIVFSGGGLSVAAASLLIAILNEAVFNSDQTENIQKLKEALEKGAEDEPEIPDVPDEPDAPDEPDSSVVYVSTAAVGVAKLGYTNLGVKLEV